MNAHGTNRVATQIAEFITALHALPVAECIAAGVTQPYLAVTHKVPYGATLQDSDLTVIDVNPAAGLAPIPASQRNQVIGKHAAADLFP